jgi:DNA-binding CsgD family transcriptional regulator
MTPEAAIDYALEKPEPSEEAETPDAYPAGLSAREVEVLRLVAKGMTNAHTGRSSSETARSMRVMHPT